MTTLVFTTLFFLLLPKVLRVLDPLFNLFTLVKTRLSFKTTL